MIHVHYIKLFHCFFFVLCRCEKINKTSKHNYRQLFLWGRCMLAFYAAVLKCTLAAALKPGYLANQQTALSLRASGEKQVLWGDKNSHLVMRRVSSAHNEWNKDDEGTFDLVLLPAPLATHQYEVRASGISSELAVEQETWTCSKIPSDTLTTV